MYILTPLLVFNWPFLGGQEMAVLLSLAGKISNFSANFRALDSISDIDLPPRSSLWIQINFNRLFRLATVIHLDCLIDPKTLSS